MSPQPTDTSFSCKLRTQCLCNMCINRNAHVLGDLLCTEMYCKLQKHSVTTTVTSCGGLEITGEC